MLILEYIILVICFIINVASVVLGAVLIRKDKEALLLGAALVVRGTASSISLLYSAALPFLVRVLPDETLATISSGVSITSFILSLIFLVLILAFLKKRMGGGIWIYPVVIISELLRSFAYSRMFKYWYPIKTDIIRGNAYDKEALVKCILLCAAVLLLILVKNLVIIIVFYRGRNLMPRYSKISVFFAVLMCLSIASQFSFLIMNATVNEVINLAMTFVSAALWVAFEVYLISNSRRIETE